MELCKKLFFTLLALCIFPAFALSNYRAVYKVEVRGVGAGTLVHDAFFTQATYRIDTVARPSMAASMLGFGEARETAKGLLQGTKVQPQTYQRSMDGKPEYALSYRFSPESHQVALTLGKEDKILSYDSDLNPLDSLSMVVQSLLDIENRRMPNEYTLVMEDNLRTYHIEKMADENWKGKDGNTMTVHVYRQSHGNRQTLVYFAENPLRLVRLEQLRKGERRFSMTLTDYQSLQ